MSILRKTNKPHEWYPQQTLAEYIKNQEQITLQERLVKLTTDISRLKAEVNALW